MTISLAAPLAGTLLVAGPPGSKGDTGNAGPQGAPGTQGPQGAQGSAGPAPWQTPVPWSSGLMCAASAPATTVVYLGSTYVCTTSHTAGGSFDGTKWQLLLGGSGYAAAASALSGTALASNVVSSSLTSLGALTALSFTALASGTLGVDQSGNVYCSKTRLTPSMFGALGGSNDDTGPINAMMTAAARTLPASYILPEILIDLEGKNWNVSAPVATTSHPWTTLCNGKLVAVAATSGRGFLDVPYVIDAQGSTSLANLGLSVTLAIECNRLAGGIRVLNAYRGRIFPTINHPIGNGIYVNSGNNLAEIGGIIHELEAGDSDFTTYGRVATLIYLDTGAGDVWVRAKAGWAYRCVYNAAQGPTFISGHFYCSSTSAAIYGIVYEQANGGNATIYDSYLDTGDIIYRGGSLHIASSCILYHLTFTNNATISGNLTSGSPTFSVSSSTGVVAGMLASGANISPGTTVSAVTGTSITLSANATGNATGESVSFGYNVTPSSISDHYIKAVASSAGQYALLSVDPNIMRYDRTVPLIKVDTTSGTWANLSGPILASNNAVHSTTDPIVFHQLSATNILARFVSPVSGSLIEFYDSATATAPRVGASGDDLVFQRGGSNRWAIYTSSNAFVPWIDNGYSVGSSINRISQLFAGTTAISTSDENEKEDIEVVPDAVLDAWGDVEWSLFKFKGGKRTHSGLVSQRVAACFTNRGLDPFTYGVVCRDTWESELAIYEPDVDINGVARLDESGVPKFREVRPARAAGERWGIRYEEASAIEAAWVRRELERLKASLSPPPQP